MGALDWLKLSANGYGLFTTYKANAAKEDTSAMYTCYASHGIGFASGLWAVFKAFKKPPPPEGADQQ